MPRTIADDWARTPSGSASVRRAIRPNSPISATVSPVIVPPRDTPSRLRARFLARKTCRHGRDPPGPTALADRHRPAVQASLQTTTCLLYTSDAADDLTRVDLG